MGYRSAMRSWKRVVIRAVATAVAGVVLDALPKHNRKRQGNASASRVEHEAIDWVETAKLRATQWLHDSDAPEHAKDLARRVWDSGVPNRVAEVATKAARGVLHEARHRLRVSR